MSAPSPKRLKLNEPSLSSITQHPYGPQQTSTFSSLLLNNSGAHNTQFPAAPAPPGPPAIEKSHPTCPNDTNLSVSTSSADNVPVNQSSAAPESSSLELSSVLIPLFHKSEEIRVQREQFISGMSPMRDSDRSKISLTTH